MNEIKEYTEKIFEDIKHIDELGNEYWLARELQSVLGYNQWRSINDLIVRAKVACKESKYNIDDHFALYRKMVDIGFKTTRKNIDYKLSRYACYLIAMNGNPKKEIIALGQTYFAIQTRKQELADNIFRIAQTDEKLKRDKVNNDYTANSVHYKVSREIRNSIERLGGTLPENLPAPDRSLKELEKENKKIKE